MVERILRIGCIVIINMVLGLEDFDFSEISII
jgi:hypothetical protein